MNYQKSLEERIAALEDRNFRVETDKAWETSWLRRVSIMILTYSTVAAYLHFVIHVNPWLNALVPVVGFFLSTLTLSYIQHRWKKHSKRIKNRPRGR